MATANSTVSGSVGFLNKMRMAMARALAGQKILDQILLDAKKAPASSITGTVLETAAADSMTRGIPRARKERVWEARGLELRAPEVAAALDVLADDATCGPEQDPAEPFVLEMVSGRGKSGVGKILTDFIKRTSLKQNLRWWLREALRDGDKLLQVVYAKDGVKFYIADLVSMPTLTMRRNEDAQGALLRGSVQGSFAFEQWDKNDQFLVGFDSLQISHNKWRRETGDPYGIPHMYEALYAARRWETLEEALVLNMLTRAVARILYTVDVTGRSDDEAHQLVQKFRDDIRGQTTGVGADRQRGDVAFATMTDIFLGRGLVSVGGKPVESTTDAKVLDTSTTAFWNVAPHRYFQNKVLSRTGVPKAHIGLEYEVNARATLQMQERRYARLVRRLQAFATTMVLDLCYAELAARGINLANFELRLGWNNPIKLDAEDAANITWLNARSDEAYSRLGFKLPNEWIAQNRYDMRPGEYNELLKQLAAQGAVGISTPTPEPIDNDGRAPVPTGPIQPKEQQGD